MSTSWNIPRNKRSNIIILSGGFDPVHIGHVRMFKASQELDPETTNTVVVGLNSDEWLTRKKGKPFMPFVERKEILQALTYVDWVYAFNDDDDTACDLIRKVTQLYAQFDETSPNIYFGNGGDRTTDTTPEIKYCEERGVEMLWGLGGGKIQSSSDLIKGSNN